jgi:hypothetical protein
LNFLDRFVSILRLLLAVLASSLASCSGSVFLNRSVGALSRLLLKQRRRQVV